jgi:hypothetical protein
MRTVHTGYNALHDIDGRDEGMLRKGTCRIWCQRARDLDLKRRDIGDEQEAKPSSVQDKLKTTKESRKHT